MYFHKNLRYLRRRFGYSQQQLAEMIGFKLGFYLL